MVVVGAHASLQDRSHPRVKPEGHALADHALALDPLLLTVHGRLDAARGAGIFPRHLAKRRTGGLLLFQRRQRLSEPQQCVRGFRRVSIANPRSRDRWGIFARSCAWSLQPARSPCAACSRCRDRTHPWAWPMAATWKAPRLRRGFAAVSRPDCAEPCWPDRA